MKFYRLIAIVVLLAGTAFAQLQSLTQQQLKTFTSAWQGDRFQDGRPKVSDDVIRRMQSVSAEEAWAVVQKSGFQDHFERGWKQFNPSDKRLVGRVVTAFFLPIRPDVDAVIRQNAKDARRIGDGENSWVIDTLQPGDVLVVDEFGKYNFMGDNLATAVFAKSGNGIVVDGGVRDLTGISKISGFTGYVRDFHPSSVTHGIRHVMLAGINVPIRIGDTTVMPGDIVLGDPEGLMFIPAQLAQQVVDEAEQVHLRDEWGHMMLREGKHTPGEIDGQWTPQMEEEFRNWLKNRPH